VAQALAELAGAHDDVPAVEEAKLRERLDALADDQMLHRLEDAARAGSLAQYRNRQSVYQFSELGYRAFTAVENVLSARIRDANLIAHYDMYHDKTTRTTSSLLILWDGDQLIDAAAGYSDNDALVTELLGLRPTRHAPLGTDATLYSAPPEPDPDPDDEEAEP
jgi:Protein of unknown function (DUF2397)